jgi:hypothetical protein
LLCRIVLPQNRSTFAHDALAALRLLAEQIIRPAVIHMLNGEVGLVRPIVVMGCYKALSQSVKAMKPVGPLRVTFP